jgi:hypothetical protein
MKMTLVKMPGQGWVGGWEEMNVLDGAFLWGRWGARHMDGCTADSQAGRVGEVLCVDNACMGRSGSFTQLTADGARLEEDGAAAHFQQLNEEGGEVEVEVVVVVGVVRNMCADMVRG